MKVLSVVVALLIVGCGNSPEPSSEEKAFYIYPMLKSVFRFMLSSKTAVRESITGIASDTKYSHLYDSLVDLSGAIGRVQKGYAKSQNENILSFFNKRKNLSKFEASIMEGFSEDYFTWAKETQESLERALEESSIYIDEKTWNEAGEKIIKSSRELSRELYPNGKFKGHRGNEDYNIRHIHARVRSIEGKLRRAPISTAIVPATAT